MVDDLGEGSEAHSAADGAASLGEQRPHLTDGQVVVERSMPNQQAGTPCAVA